MRCARCDRPTVPQALGKTGDGEVIFGWCLRCLEATGCREIEVVSPTRVVPNRPIRLDFREGRRRDLRKPPPKPRPGGLNEERLRIVGAIAIMLALWGLAVMLSGVSLYWRRPAGPPSPLGNGTPALLVGGGAVTTAVGLVFWAVTSGKETLRSHFTLLTFQVGGLLLALACILAGVIWHEPGRNPLIVLVASAALAFSAAARWLDARQDQPARGEHPSGIH